MNIAIAGWQNSRSYGPGSLTMQWIATSPNRDLTEKAVIKFGKFNLYKQNRKFYPFEWMNKYVAMYYKRIRLLCYQIIKYSVEHTIKNLNK